MELIGAIRQLQPGTLDRGPWVLGSLPPLHAPFNLTQRSKVARLRRFLGICRAPPSGEFIDFITLILSQENLHSASTLFLSGQEQVPCMTKDFWSLISLACAGQLKISSRNPLGSPLRDELYNFYGNLTHRHSSCNLGDCALYSEYGTLWQESDARRWQGMNGHSLFQSLASCG